MAGSVGSASASWANRRLSSPRGFGCAASLLGQGSTGIGLSMPCLAGRCAECSRRWSSSVSSVGSGSWRVGGRDGEVWARLVKLISIRSDQ